MVSAKLAAFGILLFYLLSIAPAYAQESCKEFWICTDWSFCIGSGVQIRTCYDVNRCDTEKDRPLETQKCTPVPVKEINLPEKQDTGVTGMLITNTPTVLGIVALVLLVLVYLMYRKAKDIRMFISPP